MGFSAGFCFEFCGSDELFSWKFWLPLMFVPSLEVFQSGIWKTVRLRSSDAIRVYRDVLAIMCILHKTKVLEIYCEIWENKKKTPSITHVTHLAMSGPVGAKWASWKCCGGDIIHVLTWHWPDLITVEIIYPGVITRLKHNHKNCPRALLPSLTPIHLNNIRKHTFGS